MILTAEEYEVAMAGYKALLLTKHEEVLMLEAKLRGRDKTVKELRKQVRALERI